LTETNAGNAANAIDNVMASLQSVGYFPDRSLATAVHLAMRLGRPLLLEGDPGVGKTELAKALALITSRQLIRLQCYDGLEQRDALYEWNHAAQLIHLRAAQSHRTPEEIEREVYQPRYLIKRALLQALQTPSPGAVLLIDEVDRADEPFEAFLLEYLGEYQISIPELGTIQADITPLTILTSNRTRDLNDAVKRRCLFHWVQYPDRERELAIVKKQVPQISDRLSEQVAQFVQRLRDQPFKDAFSRAPGVAESVEWAKALVALDTLTLDPEVIEGTAGVLFKQRDDVSVLMPMLDELLAPEK
jgi:MoxR-like ATPase